MHPAAGRIEIIAPQFSSDINREKVCTEIKKLLLDFAHYIGAFFEPVREKGSGLVLTFAKTLFHISKDLTHNMICF